MNIFILTVVCLAEGDAPPPVPNLGTALTNLMNIVESKVPPANNQAAVESMTKEGIDEAESQVSATEQDGIVSQVVSAIVAARLNTFIFTGMCVRNYTDPCPSGWKPDKLDETVDQITCSPGEVIAQGGCEAYNVSDDLTPIAKERFALKCKVQWPCSACKRDFSNCPVDFTMTKDGKCDPTNDYFGPCPETIDFRLTEDTVLKARWASRCLTQWPCIRE